MNNIFDFATTELSQDAFLCWSISWIKEDSSHPLYNYGKEILDLILGEDKQEVYKNISVKKQYKKIDIFVEFLDKNNCKHCVIIEDKINTFEHNNQLQRYMDKIKGDSNNHNTQIHLAYIKTGIIYDEEIPLYEKKVVIIDLEKIISIVSKYKSTKFEILLDFYEHFKEKPKKIEELFLKKLYTDIIKDMYGQFYFLNKIFDSRKKEHINSISNNTNINDKNKSIINCIYPVNNYGRLCTQYAFSQKKHDDCDEYHFLFWRVDSYLGSYRISLRHYDKNFDKSNEEKLKKKKEIYSRLKETAKQLKKQLNEIIEIQEKKYKYKESEVLSISLENLNGIEFSKVKKIFETITENLNESFNS